MATFSVECNCGMIMNVVSDVMCLNTKFVIAVGLIVGISAEAVVKLVITNWNTKGWRRSAQFLGRCCERRRCVYLRNDLVPANQCWRMQNGAGSHGPHHEGTLSKRSIS